MVEMLPLSLLPTAVGCSSFLLHKTASAKHSSLPSRPFQCSSRINRLQEGSTRRLERFLCQSSVSSSHPTVSIDGGHDPTTQGTQVPKLLAVAVTPPFLPSLKRLAELSAPEHAFLLLGFIAVMTTGALFALLAAAIPTLNAMRRAAISLEKLADTAREELPGTMAAIRLSGMEISDLTLELSDLSHDISEGVRSSARAVQAAEVGIRRIGALAASQTFTMLQEHASVPVAAVKPVVASAAETTWQAVAQAQRAVWGIAALPVLSKWMNKKNVEVEPNLTADEGVGVVASNQSNALED